MYNIVGRSVWQTINVGAVSSTRLPTGLYHSSSRRAFHGQVWVEV